MGSTVRSMVIPNAWAAHLFGLLTCPRLTILHLDLSSAGLVPIFHLITIPGNEQYLNMLAV